MSREVLERELLGSASAPVTPSEQVSVREAQPRSGSAATWVSARCCGSCSRIRPGARARTEVQLEWLRDPLVIEVFSALLDGTPVSELFQRLSPDAASLTQELLNAEDTAGLDADATYAEALLDLEARPLLIAYHALRGRAPTTRQGRRHSSRACMKKELAAKYPKQ